MANPSISELQDSEKFELLAQLNHNSIKEFVIEQLTKGGKLARVFMIYQFVLILIGIFFVTRAVVQAFQQNSAPLYYTLAALVFCFSALIIIHELLHGLALKITGAKKVNYGMYLKRFIFYAEADRLVLNKKQFTLVALTPLVVIQFVTLPALVIFFNHAAFYFFVFVMCAHSLFCAGDIGLLSIFNAEEGEVFTYDNKAEKTSYFYKKRHLKVP